MAGQGATIGLIAEALESNGWTVVFVCVPNTPHIGVVPIPIEGGSSNQRYPDVLSFRDGVLRLTEVEITLSEDVVEKTILRFDEQITALKKTRLGFHGLKESYGSRGTNCHLCVLSCRN